MRTFFYAVLLWLCLFSGGRGAYAAERLLYVPLDDRPVNLSYVVDILNGAGWCIVTPPRDALASRYRRGEPDRLLDWLEKEADTATAAVVAADAVLYGGLVASRTHDYPPPVLAKRLARLAAVKDKTRLYVFSTVMRSPRSSAGGVEPPYYEQWGPALFRVGELLDKEETLSLPRRERKEKTALLAALPSPVYRDWLNRRTVNLASNRQLLALLNEGAFAYLAFGKDDTAPFSQARREARELGAAIDAGGWYNCRLFTGADQLGLLLLTRAVCDRNIHIPFVHAVYAPGVGRLTVPSYEDTPVEDTAAGNIAAAGGWSTRSATDADLVLLINTPPDGMTREAMFTPDNTVLRDEHTQSVVASLKKLVEAGPVALADIRFANGASNALLDGLEQSGLTWCLAAYAGWNTAGNSLGYAVGQGILAPHTPDSHRRRLLATRYLDEWAYQANAREVLYKTKIWPRGQDGTRLNKDRPALEQAAQSLIAALAAEHMPDEDLAPLLAGLKVSFPWDRLFEIDIKFTGLNER